MTARGPQLTRGANTQPAPDQGPADPQPPASDQARNQRQIREPATPLPGQPAPPRLRGETAPAA